MRLLQSEQKSFSSSVTIFGRPLTSIKIAQLQVIFDKVGSKFCQIPNKPLKSCQRLLKSDMGTCTVGLFVFICRQC